MRARSVFAFLAFLASAIALAISASLAVALSAHAEFLERVDELAEEWGAEWLVPLLSGTITFGAVLLPLVCVYFVRRRMPALELWVPAARRALRKNAAGLALYNRRAYQAAVVEFDEALRLNPKLGTAYYNRGTAYLMLHRLDEAERDFQAALPFSKRACAAHLGLGNIAVQRGDLNRALLECNTALEIDAADGRALTSR